MCTFSLSLFLSCFPTPVAARGVSGDQLDQGGNILVTYAGMFHVLAAISPFLL